MPDQDDNDKPSRSWSQYDSWRKCPKSFELSKIHRVPRRPGVWFPAGTAVHKSVETYLRQKLAEAGHGA